MIREKIQGTILNVLSMAMYSGMPFLTAYSGSKAALAIMKELLHVVEEYVIIKRIL